MKITSPAHSQPAEIVLRAAEAAFDLAVVDADPQLRACLAVELGDTEVATYPDVPALLERLRPGQPAVVVLGPALANDGGLAQLEVASRSRPEMAAILVVDELSTSLLQKALRSGARDVLTLPVEPHALRESVARVGQAVAVGHSATPGEAPRRDTGRVITVCSTKGGSGKSVVATNLAVALAKCSERPVALVDADLQFGDVALMLGLAPRRTIADAVTSIDRLDATSLRNLLVCHEPSGLLVLPAPVEPSFADQVTGADVARIIEVLQSFCSYVVVDTHTQFSDVVLALIDHSDDLLLVTALEIPSVKNLKLALHTLRLLSVPEAKLKLVVNRADSEVRLSVGQVEESVGMKATSLVPSDVAVPRSANKGAPVVLDAPRSRVAQVFQDLAAVFSPSRAQVPAKGRGRFGRF